MRAVNARQIMRVRTGQSTSSSPASALSTAFLPLGWKAVVRLSRAGIAHGQEVAARWNRLKIKMACLTQKERQLPWRSAPMPTGIINKTFAFTAQNKTGRGDLLQRVLHRPTTRRVSFSLRDNQVYGVQGVGRSALGHGPSSRSIGSEDRTRSRSSHSPEMVSIARATGYMVASRNKYCARSG